MLSVTAPGHSYGYPDEVRFELPESDHASDQQAADLLNPSHADLLSAEHAFGSVCDAAGNNLIVLLKRLPVVTTMQSP